MRKHFFSRKQTRVSFRKKQTEPKLDVFANLATFEMLLGGVNKKKKKEKRIGGARAEG